MQQLKTSDSTPNWTEIREMQASTANAWTWAHYLIFKLSDDPEEKWHVFDYDQVMMVCDMLSARTFTLRYNHILDDTTPGKIPEERP